MLPAVTGIVTRQSTRSLAVMSSKAGVCLALIASLSWPTVSSEDIFTGNALDEGSPLTRQNRESVFAAMDGCFLVMEERGTCKWRSNAPVNVGCVRADGGSKEQREYQRQKKVRCCVRMET
ncbi:hypothetical protein BC939DRAFT_448342 [Gamsiella multidivaricata]|uniref:uncharacterized protein n=1 Tax=Gamsiella multidivaricata TaxID=101098 RepID=UPI00221FADF0|nr:uncharacterized protein BC939DRAFT_448342 [Gamsiella multidivaricata]KAI7825252.1 hypothetical protein BC939DRAFT_448342 [Gamsiella multidivaricata]